MTHKTWAFSLASVLVIPIGLMGACESDDTETTATTSSSSSGAGGSTSGTGGQGGDGAWISTGGSTTSGTGGSGGTTSTSSSSGLPPPPTEVSECQGHIYACGDLVDNDADGAIDYQDSDCLGPCDDTEDSYFGGIPGQTGPKCKLDCYFDQDSGSGNDDCYWDHVCDPLSVSPNYYPEPAEGVTCEYAGAEHVVTPIGETCANLVQAQSQDCLDFCLPLTPNGCDCFGCCELPADSGDFVWLGSEGIEGTTVCTADKVTDPDFCHPCTPVQDCYNDCGVCELCLGKTVLPPECFEPDGGTTDQCPNGEQACGLPGQDPCPSGYFCITGCCQPVPQ